MAPYSATLEVEDDIMQDTSSGPTRSKRSDRVNAAIWQNQGSREKGSDPWFNTTLSRSYRTASGEWRETKISLDQRDLPHAKTLIDWAMGELLDMDDS